MSPTVPATLGGTQGCQWTGGVPRGDVVQSRWGPTVEDHWDFHFQVFGLPLLGFEFGALRFTALTRDMLLHGGSGGPTPILPGHVSQILPGHVAQILPGHVSQMLPRLASQSPSTFHCQFHIASECSAGGAAEPIMRRSQASETLSACTV